MSVKLATERSGLSSTMAGMKAADKVAGPRLACEMKVFVEAQNHLRVVLCSPGYQLKTILSLDVRRVDSNRCEEVNDMAVDAAALQVSCRCTGTLQCSIEVGGSGIDVSTLLGGTEDLC
jgi:hypothetical protein